MRLGLLTLCLPAGISTIELAVPPDGWDALGSILTAFTIAALAGWAWRQRRRAGRSAGPARRPGQRYDDGR